MKNRIDAEGLSLHLFPKALSKVLLWEYLIIYCQVVSNTINIGETIFESFRNQGSITGNRCLQQ
jgi:hypothetical protein